MSFSSIRDLEKNISHVGISKERQYFLENLAVLVDSGMDIYTVLQALKDDMHSRVMKSIITQMQQEVAQGSPLWSAMKNADIFSDYIIALVKLGEESSHLSQNLLVLSRQQEKNHVFSSKLRSALMYPSLVLGMAALLGILITMFILPQLTQVFASLNVQLPLMTRIVIAVGDFFGAYGLIVGPLLIGGLVLLVFFLFLNPRTLFIGQKMLFAVPLIRKIIMYIEVARMTYVLGILMQNNIPILQSIHSLYQSSRMSMYKTFYSFLYTAIANGDSFEKAFREYGYSVKLVPPAIQQLIFAGEESGRLSETFLKISQIYEDKSETAAKNLTVLLEPLMLIIIWLGVLFLALAIILPIYGLLSGIQ